MSIPKEYYIERSIRLPFYILSTLFYSSLLIRSKFYPNLNEENNKNAPKIKKRIHILCLIVSIFLLIASIDPGPIFGILPELLFNELQETSSVILAGIFCMIISSHFEAHYQVMRKEMPNHLKYLFGGNVILFFIELCLITDIGTWATKQMKWTAIGFCGAVMFLTIFIAVDFYGYLLIRRLFMSEDGNISHARRAYTKPDKRLRRINCFHGCMLTALLVFDIILIANLVDWIASGEINGQVPEKEGKYEFDVTIVIYPICLIIYGWWSFTPIFCLATSEDHESTTQRTTRVVELEEVHQINASFSDPLVASGTFYPSPTLGSSSPSKQPPNDSILDEGQILTHSSSLSSSSCQSLSSSISHSNSGRSPPSSESELITDISSHSQSSNKTEGEFSGPSSTLKGEGIDTSHHSQSSAIVINHPIDEIVHEEEDPYFVV